MTATPLPSMHQPAEAPAPQLHGDCSYVEYTGFYVHAWGFGDAGMAALRDWEYNRVS